MFVFIQVGYLSLSFQVGDCEGYLDMTSTRVSTPSTSGTTSKSSTRYKIKTFNFKSNVDHCGQVKDSVKELSKLLSSLLHSQSKVLIFTTTKNPTTFVFSLTAAPTTTLQAGPVAPSTGPTTRSWTRRGTRWTCRRWWSWRARRWERGSFRWSVLASAHLQPRFAANQKVIS